MSASALRPSRATESWLTGTALAPNPASRDVVVHYALGTRSGVTISVVDNLGNERIVRDEGVREAGRAVATLPVGELAAGVYRVVVRSGGGSVSRTLLVR